MIWLPQAIKFSPHDLFIIIQVVGDQNSCPGQVRADLRQHRSQVRTPLPGQFSGNAVNSGGLPGNGKTLGLDDVFQALYSVPWSSVTSQANCTRRGQFLLFETGAL